MKEFELENIDRECPTKCLAFLDDLTERVVAEISREKRRHKRPWDLSDVCELVAVSCDTLALLPFGSGTILSVCPTMKPSPSASIDEIFQSISTDERCIFNDE